MTKDSPEFQRLKAEHEVKEKQGLPTSQAERLTDDDFETIRIHLSAYKEKLCNQHRWEEAEEYQRIIERFTILACSHPDMSGYSDKLWRSAYERGKAEANDEIIHCKDCKHYKASEYTGRLACHYVIGGTVTRNPNDFCSRAERITDGQDRTSHS